MRRLVPTLALVAAISAVATAACGHFHTFGAHESAVIFFTNEGLDDVAVFVVAPGTGDRRLGTVLSGRTDTLTVPGDLASRGGAVSIVARNVLRTSSVSTGLVAISPGEVYQVRLMKDARLLSFLPAPEE